MGIDYSTGAWRGFAGPPKLPADIQAKLVAAHKKVYDSKEYKDFMSGRGFGIKWADPQGFAQFMDTADEQMGKAMKAAGLSKV
jgi:tripartite-type tricarboxylate transporter receptor subunit TctC